MDLLLSGIAVLLLTGLVFWSCLPRGGKLHRFVGTEMEPYGLDFAQSCAACSLVLKLGKKSTSAKLSGKPQK
jgi:hypothetical protein